MKIVDFETFLNLPNGTVYMTYSPIIYGHLCVKGTTYHPTPTSHPDFFGDYYELDFSDPSFGDSCGDDMDGACRMEDGEKVDADWSFCRVEASSDKANREQLYAVLDDADLHRMIEILKGGLVGEVSK